MHAKRAVDTQMTGLIIICVVLLGLGLLFSRGKWYAPAVLSAGVWLMSVVSYTYIDAGQHLLKPETVQSVTFWLVGFCVATWCVQSVYIKPLFVNVKSSVPARDIYYYFTVATLPVLAVWVATIIMRSGGNPFSALRDANIEEVRGIRTASFFVLVWMVSYIMELQVLCENLKEKGKSLKEKTGNIGRLIVLFLANFFYAFASMGKMNFMILFLATLIILTEAKVVRLQHLALALGVMLVFFVGVQKIRGSFTTPRHFAALYLTTSLANLDQNLEPCSAEQPAENSCRLYYAVRSGLDGGKTKVVDPVLDFDWVEVGDMEYYGNTYTALYPFYKDFGKWGVLAFSVLLGLIFGYLFKTAEDNSQFALVMYAILAGCVVMQFIGDTFFTVLSQNIQYLVAALVPYVISKYNLLTEVWKKKGW